VNEQTGQPAGIVTAADIDRAIADGKDVNDIRVHAVMTARGRQRQQQGPERRRPTW
jgi:CBS domain-containing protein